MPQLMKKTAAACERDLAAAQAAQLTRAAQSTSQQRAAEAEQLRQQLAAAGGNHAAQVRAWDATFAELVRHVRLHCTERGELLEEVRCRYDDWIAHLKEVGYDEWI